MLHTGAAGGVTIAFLDSGIFPHEEFAGRILAGINVNEPDNPIGTLDTIGHGTHVAGISTARGDNGTGMAGVHWGANLLPVKVTNAGGFTSGLHVGNGLIWAADQGAEVINMSVLNGGNRQQLATTVFVPGAVAAPAGKMAIVLQAPSLLTPWLLSTLVFAIFIFVAVQSGAAAIIRWFHLRIAEPLRDAADPEGSLSRLSENATTTGPNDGFLAQTVESYRGLARELSRTRTQLRRMENEVDEKIRVHQEGFHRQLRRAEDKALIDPLTRLHNRAFMESELERLYDEQKSRKHDLSVVMIDVDHFKYHNDTQGHKAGDDVLRFIGDLLRGATRPTDRCIRYGGDEFIMLLPGCSAKSAAEIAERIIRMFGQFASTLKSAKPPSMSAGIASLATDPSTTGHELLGFADRNLYAVKRKGKNAVAVTT